MANYYNLQMDKPWGREGGSMLDPEEMLREHEIIGISEWEGADCYTFKDAPEGSIVLVRKGNHAIALVEILSDNFHDREYREKYTSTVFHHVRVLDWADNYKQPRPGLFSQGTFRRNINPNSEQYQYIDEWYNSL